MASDQFSQATTRQFCQNIAPEETAKNQILLHRIPLEFNGFSTATEQLNHDKM